MAWLCLVGNQTAVSPSMPASLLLQRQAHLLAAGLRLLQFLIWLKGGRSAVRSSLPRRILGGGCLPLLLLDLLEVQLLEVLAAVDRIEPAAACEGSAGGQPAFCPKTLLWLALSNSAEGSLVRQDCCAAHIGLQCALPGCCPARHRSVADNTFGTFRVQQAHSNPPVVSLEGNRIVLQAQVGQLGKRGQRVQVLQQWCLSKGAEAGPRAATAGSGRCLT